MSLDCVYCSHGTRCAGLVASVKNNLCTVGAAFKAKIGGLLSLSVRPFVFCPSVVLICLLSFVVSQSLPSIQEYGC